MTNSVSVEQCDRDLLASLVGNEIEADEIRRGLADFTQEVRSIARHRIEALRQSSEREEKLRALVEQAFLEGYSLVGTPRDAGRSWELSESRQALEATNG